MGAVGMTTGQAQLVLELVNYPGTDLALLDDEVALDRRAAPDSDSAPKCPPGEPIDHRRKRQMGLGR